MNPYISAPKNLLYFSLFLPCFSFRLIYCSPLLSSCHVPCDPCSHGTAATHFVIQHNASAPYQRSATGPL